MVDAGGEWDEIAYNLALLLPKRCTYLATFDTRQ